MSQAAQAVQQMVNEMKDAKEEQVAKRKARTTTKPKGEKKEAKPRAARSKAAKPKVSRQRTPSLPSKDKVTLNSAAHQVLIVKALKSALPGLSEGEQADAKVLIGRLEKRGAR